MNGNDLRILVTANLNTGKSIGEINTAIKGIEKKIKSLKLNIEVNDKVLNTLSNFNKQMEQISKTAKNTGKIVESALLPNGTKITRTFFDGLNKEFQQTINDTKRVGQEMLQTTGNIEQQIKTVKSLTEEYKYLTKEAKSYNVDGSLKNKTSTYLNDKGNARVIKTDSNDNVISTKDLTDYGNLIKVQEQARKSLQELAKTGRYTNEELRKIGQGINLSTTVNQVEQLNNRMKNMRFGTNLTRDQEKLTNSLERVFNQGKVTEQEFNKFNNAIKSSKNISELEKLQREINKTVTKYDATTLQNKLTNDAEKLLRTHANTVDVQGVQDFINKVNAINPASKNALNGLKNLQNELSVFRNNASEAARTSMTFGQQLKIALERVPIWAVATTAIYGTSHAVKDLLNNLILVDGQMTELKRVMDSNTNFNQLLSDSVEMSKDLGRSLEDVNNALIMAAKTGANAKDSLELARTATIASNVSELTAEEAMTNLISITTQFNMKASESINVIDKLNEVDNNYATSTRDLSDALAKAGSVAQTYNITLDEMIGLATAMQVATRASGTEVGNSLKTIISRLSSNDSLKAMKELGIEINNVSDASEILQKISDKWNTLTSAQQQNLGVVIAGRWQLSKFLGLMNNYQMAIDSTNTSLHSENSAIIENQKYLNSMEAKLAELKNSWYEFSLAVGDSGIADVFMGAVIGLTKLGNSATNFVRTFGSIPALFGMASAGALLLSKNLRNFLTTENGINALKKTFQNMNNHLSTTRTSIRDATVGMTGFQRVTTATGIAWNRLGVSIRSALISTGIGVAITVISMALGKLTENLIKAKEEQAKVKQESEKLALSYSLNQDKITSLVSEYKNLQSQVKSGLLPENDKRYLEVQNELNKLLPNLTKNTDKLGNARLKSASAIDSEIEYLNKLSNLQSQKFIDNFGETVDKSSKKINNLKSQIDELVNGKRLKAGRMAGTIISPPDDSPETEIAKLVKQKEIKVATEELVNSYKKLGIEYAKVMGYSKNLTNEDQAYIASIINKNKEILTTEDGMKKVESKIKSFIISTGELRKAIGDIFTTDEIRGFSDNQKAVLKSISEGVQSGYKDWGQYKNILKEVGFTTDEVNAIIDNLNKVTKNQSDANKAATISAAELDKVLKEASKQYENSISNIKSLNGVLEELKQSHKLSADSVGILMNKYPNLLTYMNDEKALSNAIQKEIKNETKVAQKSIQQKLMLNSQYFKSSTVQNSTFIKNIAKLYGIDLQNTKNLAEAKSKVEAQLIKILGKNWSQYYKILANGQAKLYGVEIDNLVRGAMQGSDEANKKLNQLYASMKKYNDAVKNIENGFNNLTLNTVKSNIKLEDYGKTIDKNTSSKNKNTKSTKNSSKATEDYIYVSDKYKKAIDDINIKIAKQQNLQSKYPTYSKQYQNAIKEEIKLLKQKKDAIDKETKSLDAQIKTGKIKQTGVVKKSESVIKTSSSSKSSSYVKGNSNQATIWNFLKSKGLSDNAVAGIMGNIQVESSFNPNALGPQTKYGRAYGIAQWLGGRKTALLKYAKSKGTSASNLQTQLEFLWKELNSTEKKSLNYVKSNSNASPSTIAKMWDTLFERSGGSLLSKRASNANSIYNKYSGKKVVGTSSSSGSSGSIPTLKLGSSGSWVKKLQKELGVVVDGIFGKQTLAAVKAYQKKKGLTADGIVGKSTWSKLGVKTSSSSSKAKAEGKQAKDKAIGERNQLKQESLDIEKQIQEKYKQLIDAVVSGFEKQQNDFDIELQKSEDRMSRLVSTSSAYRKELEKQKKILADKQKVNNNEIKSLNKINSEKKLSSSQIKKNEEEIKSLEKKNKAYKLSAKEREKNQKKIDSLNKKNNSDRKKISSLDKQNKDKNTSKKQREKNNKEIAKLKADIKKNDKEIDKLESANKKKKLSASEIKKNNAKIEELKKANSAKKLSSAIRSQNSSLIKELEKANEELKNKLADIEYQRVNSIIDSYENEQSSKDIDIRKKELELETIENKNSNEYKQNLADQINLHLDKKRLLEAEIKYIKDQIKNNETLTDAQKEELNNLVADYQNKVIEIDVTVKEKKEEIKQIYNDIADQYVEAMKDAYEKARDVEIEALNETRKAREKVHKEIMDNYDEEEKKLDELYNKKMREIDDQQSSDNYNKELIKKQKEAEEIQKKINKLSMDDSIWAKKQREDLEKQLADKQEEIAQFVNDRNVELRKQGLSDELDASKKAIDERRDIENKAYETQQEEWDQLEKDINRKYDNFINDERHWSQVRQDILNGDVAKYKDSIEEITDTISKNNKIIGESITNNIIDVLAAAQKGLNSIKSSYNDVIATAEAEDKKARAEAEAKLIADIKKNEEDAKAKGISKYEVTWTDKKTGEFDRYLEFKTKKELDDALKKYNNSKLNTEIKIIYKKVKSYDVTLTNPKTGDEIEKSLNTQSEVDAFVKKYPDYIPQVLPKYHKGGIIGDTPNSRVTELVNKLFNTKPNEQIVKGLEGELMIPPKNIVNGLNNIRNLITSTPPLLTPVTTTGNTEINMNINIEKLMGGEKGANEMFKVLNKKLAKMGVK